MEGGCPGKGPLPGPRRAAHPTTASRAWIAHQLCAAHLLRDLEAAAQDYPDAVWPGQIAGELRALIHAANVARDAGLASVPDEETAGHLRLFRHGVAVGLSEVPRVPGGNKKQPPARCLLGMPEGP